MEETKTLANQSALRSLEPLKAAQLTSQIPYQAAPLGTSNSAPKIVRCSFCRIHSRSNAALSPQGLFWTISRCIYGFYCVAAGRVNKRCLGAVEKPYRYWLDLSLFEHMPIPLC